MKKSVLLIAFCLIINLNGGEYYSSIPEDYDIKTSLFYYPIKQKPDTNRIFSDQSDIRIKNILIFDPKEKKQWYLFEKNKIWDIRYLNFESYKENNNIIFFSGNYKIKNQIKLNREIKNKMFLITAQKNSDKLIMWFCNKKGENLKKVFEFDKEDKWHLDIKNSKIRFISHKDEIFINSINW